MGLDDGPESVGSFARHGFFDLDLTVKGDLEVDTHHTIEDTGIVLGQAIRKAVGDKKGIMRYGSQILPMDESLVLCQAWSCHRRKAPQKLLSALREWSGKYP